MDWIAPRIDFPMHIVKGFGNLTFDRFVVAKYASYGFIHQDLEGLKDPRDKTPREPTANPLSRMPLNPWVKNPQCNSNAPLQELPAEVKLKIMWELTSVFELRCLITVAPDFFRAFKAGPANRILEILKYRERISLLKEYIQLGFHGRRNFTAAIKEYPEIPVYVPQDLLALEERDCLCCWEAPILIVRTFYGDEDVSKETCQAEYEKWEEFTRSTLSITKATGFFNDCTKHEHGNNPLEDAGELPPWLLQTLSYTTDFVDYLAWRNDPESNCLARIWVFGFDKIACIGGGTFYFTVNHCGKIHTGDWFREGCSVKDSDEQAQSRRAGRVVLSSPDDMKDWVKQIMESEVIDKASGNNPFTTPECLVDY